MSLYNKSSQSMREIRIYQHGDYHVGQQWELSLDAGQHVGVVLRMQVGDALTLFNGENSEFQTTIVGVKKKQVVVEINTAQTISRESSLKIHLGQALSKGDKMELVVQKAVELGVYRITPLITERAVMKLDAQRQAKKLEQWQSIAVAACEQCGRNVVPIIDAPLVLNEFIRTIQTSMRWILHTEGNKRWRDYPLPCGEVTLLIGPEGGFSESEVQMATMHHFLPLSLGPRILRTETAAISALSLLQAVGGDL